MTLSAFGRKDLTLLVNLVGRRQETLLEKDLANSDLELIPSRVWVCLERVAIKECLGADVS